MPLTYRWKVRESIGGILGDLFYLTATEDAPDQNTALWKDRRHLSRDEMLVQNMDVVVVQSTAAENLYERTRIASLDRPSRTATLEPELPAYTRGGDVAHAFMHRGTGWRIEEYDRIINEVLAEMDRAYAQEVREEIVTGFERNSPYISVPDDWIGVWDVEWQDSQGLYWSINEQFDLDKVDRQIIIPWNDAVGMQGRVVRISGYQAYPELTADDDTTKCPIGYLKWMGAANLLLSGEARQITDEVENKAMLYLQRGTEFMQQAVSTRRPNVRWFD